MSSAAELCVIQPTEIRSTPVAAIAGAVAAVMRPEASVITLAARHGNRLPEVVDAHIVEQDRIGAKRQRLLELRQRIDLDLDLDHVTGMGLGTRDRGADIAGERDVVVLDQHGIVEAETVIAAAAGPHGVFLQGPQAGRGLAGADDLSPRALYR